MERLQQNVTYFQIALVRVKDNSLVLVIFSHHLHTKSVNGSLEVCLLSIYHNADIFVPPILKHTDKYRLKKIETGCIGMNIWRML